MMTAMIEPPDSKSDSDDSENPSPPHSKSTVNPKLKHPKANENQPNNKPNFQI